MFSKSLVVAVLVLGSCGVAIGSDRPNVLFIAVDDLNHWVGHLERNSQTVTPNLDRLAAMGVSFTNAHCAAPVCNASRAALLSGKRPSTSGVYDNGQPFQRVIQPEESLFSHFKASGYETLGMGKLWHGGLAWPKQWTGHGPKEQAVRAKLDDRSIGGIKFGVLDGDDDAVSDTQIASYAIEQLGKSHDKPFFLAVGFHKPHMPWNVPQQYYDMHPLSEIELPPFADNDLNDIPPAGIKMAKPNGDHQRVLKSGRWNEAVQAYLATISYLDGQVGRVLDAYEKSPERDNTIICLWGDHGWHLGEKHHWRKFALWEEATRAPLIWVVPGTTPEGQLCAAPIDFISVYPTLCSLTGLDRPQHVEGLDITLLLAEPTTEWTHSAVTTFRRNNHAVRSDRWRLIRYANGDEELYDHDADQYEWTNLANRPEYAATKAELAAAMPSRNAPAVAKNKKKQGKAK